MISFIKKRLKYIVVLLINVGLAVAVIVLFFGYMSDYNKMLYEQNLSDIRNINYAKAQITSEMTQSHATKLNNIHKYLNAHKYTELELINFIADSNSDENVSFHLISSDYSAMVLEKGDNGEFPVVSYKSTDYLVIKEIVDSAGSNREEIPFVSEFTDPYTGSRSFGRYIYVSTFEGDVKIVYTLLAVFKSSAFSQRINIDGGFEQMSTVLINKSGGYALQNSEFKSDNFFQYLYIYNSLSLD